jgi:2-amino-4-hydroxy-6-hydroxymethyldihydropteridine diphosphokinase
VKTAYVGLGSNLGEPLQQVRRAIARLREMASGCFRASALWESTPIDCPPGSPVFINAVVAFEPLAGETPETLLGKLQVLEREFGRRPKTVLNEPRPLDLDLLAFGNEVRDTKELTLPHPRAHRRRFVLQPLTELGPELVFPGQTGTVAQLLARLPPEPGLRRVASN